MEEAVQEANRYSDIGEDHLRIYAEVFQESQLGTTGPIVEFGTRAGGSALLWLRLTDRFVFTVDPYGEKPYSKGVIDQSEYRYGEDLAVDAKVLLGGFPNHAHFRLTAEDFTERLYGSSFWHSGSHHTLGGISFAFLDADHSGHFVVRMLAALGRWMEPDGVVLIDNVDWNLTPVTRQLAGYMAREVVREGTRYLAIRLAQPRA